MAALIDAIDVKRKTFFEFDDAPFLCLEAAVSTPTARGTQTLVRLKMRNLLTRAVFDKTFKASDRFKEPDLQTVPASYLYSDGTGFHFMDQSDRLAASASRRAERRLYRTGSSRRLIQRHRDQGREARNRHRDSCPSVH